MTLFVSPQQTTKGEAEREVERGPLFNLYSDFYFIFKSRDESAVDNMKSPFNLTEYEFVLFLINETIERLTKSKSPRYIFILPAAFQARTIPV